MKTLPNKFSSIEENSSSFINRFYIYQKERFPFLLHGILISSFSFSAISYSRICRGATSFISLKSFISCILITTSLFFLVRIFDEFKDAEDDARYRAELPVPRGLITLKELGYIGITIVSFQLSIILIFFPKIFLLYFIIIIYLLLMGKEFFISTWLKKHQFWYVISHMFIIPFIDMFASSFDWKLENAYPSKGLLFFFAVSYMNGIVLEIGRKIRIPENESAGVLTYSSMLGANKAVLMWALTLTITLLLSIAASAFAGYGMAVFLSLGCTFILCSLPMIAFLRTKSQKLSKSIEYASALWTIAMYLILGGAPMILKFLFK